MKRILMLTFVFLMIALPALAQVADSASAAPATRDDILKLFDTMHIRDQMRLVMDSVAKQQREMIREGLKRRAPQMTEQDLARLDQFTSDMLKDFPVDGMLDDMIPVYQKHLNKADVDAMNAFYQSPTGQKMLREMPAMTAESMQASSPRIQAMMDKVMERAEQLAREERNKKTQTEQPATQKN
jgi:Uncharacterized protein conserved in bacteria